MDDDYREINQALVRVYNGIMWIEEHELRKSSFSDLTIKEMHAIDAISMYKPDGLAGGQKTPPVAGYHDRHH